MSEAPLNTVPLHDIPKPGMTQNDFAEQLDQTLERMRASSTAYQIIARVVETQLIDRIVRDVGRIGVYSDQYPDIIAFLESFRPPDEELREMGGGS